MSIAPLAIAPIGSRSGFRWRWTMAFVAGELIGFVPPAVVGVTAVAFGVSDVVLVIALTLAGTLEGASIGFAQAHVLSQRKADLDRRAWIRATALAAGFAWLVGMGGSVILGSRRIALGPGLAAFVPLSVLALLAMGFLQWRVLRRVLGGAQGWPLVNAGAWLIGVAIPVVALSVVPNRWPAAAHVVVAVLAAAVMGLIVGSITGWRLDQLLETNAEVGARQGSGLVRWPRWQRATLAAKFVWTMISCFVVESVVFGLAALPATLFYQWHLGLNLGPEPLRLFLLAAAFLPAYVIFAILFMALSAEATRLLGWRPPQRAELRIAELPVELRNWARYAIASHLVHVVAGSIFRSTPIWVWYMRRNGARIGRHVWINSLQVGDDCLLELGDEVVVGAGVHLSGHTSERGMIILAPISLGRGTTVGLGAHIGIGVTSGENTQIGSMSVVPKNTWLEADTTYVGIPARPIHRGGEDVR